MRFFAALLLAIVAVTPPPRTPPKIGEPAPAFTLRNQNRRPVSLSAAAGTKVVLVFYRGYW